MTEPKKRAALGVFLLSLLLLAAPAGGANADRADCGKALASAQKTPETQFLKAHCLAREGRHAEVLEALAEIKGKLAFMQDYMLYYEARAALGLGRKERAEALLLRILKHHPDSAVAQRRP